MANLPALPLHYVCQGEGPTVLLLHGFPATWRCWDRVMEKLSSRYRVVAPDLRGYHLSGRPSGVGEYSSEKVAGDIVHLLDHLGEQKVRLVGHDWGGAVAYHLAAYHPHRIDRLSVLNCPHPVELVRHLRSNGRQLRRSWYILFFQLPWLPEFLIRGHIDRFLASVFRPESAFTAEEIAHYREALLLPGALTAALNYYRAAGRAALARRQRWPIIECPFQLIWGRRDPALGVELSEHLERYFSNPVLREYLPEAGHWVFSQEPERVCEVLLSFLG